MVAEVSGSTKRESANSSKIARNDAHLKIVTPLDPSDNAEDLFSPDQEARHRHAEQALRDHAWLHYSRMKSVRERGAPIIVGGAGCYVWDSQGKRYLDALSGLFTVQIGYGRRELAQVAAEQMEALAFASHFGNANLPSIELAERIAHLAPPSLNRVFFTSGGSEAVESALKLARQYQRMRGFSGRHKVLSRRLAYHGSTMGALSVNGVTSLRTPFEPMLSGARHVTHTSCYRCAYCNGDGSCGRPLRDIEEAIEFEGAETVAAIIVEPVQNSGGCFSPPPGYLQGIRELCDKHGILYISDEVICAYGRLGDWFGSTHYGVEPDIITMAKGMSSGYQPIGGCLISDRVAETFMQTETDMFAHGLTFGGHPVAAAVALKNLEIMENEGVLENVQRFSPYFRALMNDLAKRHAIVGEVRGEGYFLALELVKDKATKETFSDAESEDLLRGFLSGRMQSLGLICRADDRGDPVIQLSPPLIAGADELDEIATILDTVLGEASQRL